MNKALISLLMLCAVCSSASAQQEEGLDFEFHGCAFRDGLIHCSMEFVNNEESTQDDYVAVWAEFGELVHWCVESGTVTVVNDEYEWEWQWEVELRPGRSTVGRIGIAPPDRYPVAVMYRWTKGDETSSGSDIIQEPQFRYFPFWGQRGW